MFPFTIPEETPEQRFARDAARWWLGKIREENGLEATRPHRPLDWLDEITGSASYPPAVGWVLHALDHPKRCNTEQYLPFMEALVPRGEGGEWDWVKAVEAAVVVLYRGSLQTSDAPLLVEGAPCPS